ncbi:phosphopantetheine-binding protein, partial [Cognatiluteimonas telluris]|uniref:phosphopantetheine-binding protein n=1 Tax=Cognatiluteimonas telluris TaxID=1104775 RepID=UPI001FAF19D3
HLRSALAAQVAEHLVPAAFVVLDHLPLTANGKLDRDALPAPDDASVPRCEYEAPVGEIEQALADIWQDLLGLERVGRHDKFFELGGHSLMAVQVVSRLHRSQGVELPLRELFTQSTLAALAKVVSSAQIAGFDQADVHRLSDALDGMTEEELLAIWEVENSVTT